MTRKLLSYILSYIFNNKLYKDMSDVQFVDGLMVKKPHPNAPDFVKGSLSIKREDLLNWLQGQSGEWINVDIKESRKGTWYAQVNDWQPSGGQGGGQQGKNQPQAQTDVPMPSEPSMDDDDFDIDLKDVPF